MAVMNMESTPTAYNQGAALINEGRQAEALAHFQRHAQAGDAHCQYGLGRALLQGDFAAEQRLSAVQWLTRSSDAGVAEASELLAQAAIGNRLVARDLPVIAQVLCATARQGLDASVRAMATLLSASGIPPRGPVTPAQCLALIEARLTGLPKPTQLCERPGIYVVDDALNAAECNYLIQSAQGSWRASQVFNTRHQSAQQHAIRTSDDARIESWMEDILLRLIQLRLALIADSELVFAEPLSLLHYRPGQEYRPHWDLLPPEALATRHPEAGQRRRTLCCYLNDVADGGETDFPAAGVRVTPRQGRAVIFDNTSADGTPLMASEHAGLAVRKGEKYLATLWFRQWPVRPY